MVKFAKNKREFIHALNLLELSTQVDQNILNVPIENLSFVTVAEILNGLVLAFFYGIEKPQDLKYFFLNINKYCAWMYTYFSAIDYTKGRLNIDLGYKFLQILHPKYFEQLLYVSVDYLIQPVECFELKNLEFLSFLQNKLLSLPISNGSMGLENLINNMVTVRQVGLEILKYYKFFKRTKLSSSMIRRSIYKNPNRLLEILNIWKDRSGFSYDNSTNNKH